MRLIAHQGRLGFSSSCLAPGLTTNTRLSQKMHTRRSRLGYAMSISVTKLPAMPGNFGKNRLALTCMEVGTNDHITFWPAFTR